MANPRGFWLVFHTLHNISSGFVVVRVSMDHTFYHLSSLYILYTKYHPHTMPILLFLISLHVGEILCFLCFPLVDTRGHIYIYIYIGLCACLYITVNIVAWSCDMLRHG